MAFIKCVACGKKNKKNVRFWQGLCSRQPGNCYSKWEKYIRAQKHWWVRFGFPLEFTPGAYRVDGGRQLEATKILFDQWLEGGAK